MNNQDSLRAQIIEAISNHGKQRAWSDHKIVVGVDLFDVAIMPVLDAAMKAGELLVHRATTPQKPVPDAIIAWLELVVAMIAHLHTQEASISRRELLNAFYTLEQSCNKALADSRAISQHTASGVTGNLLAGNSNIPAKG